MLGGAQVGALVWLAVGAFTTFGDGRLADTVVNNKSHGLDAIGSLPAWLALALGSVGVTLSFDPWTIRNNVIGAGEGFANGWIDMGEWAADSGLELSAATTSFFVSLGHGFGPGALTPRGNPRDAAALQTANEMVDAIIDYDVGFAQENRAQEVGAFVGTAVDLAFGVKGLVKAGGKVFVKLGPGVASFIFKSGDEVAEVVVDVARADEAIRAVDGTVDDVTGELTIGSNDTNPAPPRALDEIAANGEETATARRSSEPDDPTVTGDASPPPLRPGIHGSHSGSIDELADAWNDATPTRGTELGQQASRAQISEEIGELGAVNYLESVTGRQLDLLRPTSDAAVADFARQFDAGEAWTTPVAFRGRNVTNIVYFDGEVLHIVEAKGGAGRYTDRISRLNRSGTPNRIGQTNAKYPLDVAHDMIDSPKTDGRNIIGEIVHTAYRDEVVSYVGVRTNGHNTGDVAITVVEHTFLIPR